MHHRGFGFYFAICVFGEHSTFYVHSNSEIRVCFQVSVHHFLALTESTLERSLQ